MQISGDPRKLTDPATSYLMEPLTQIFGSGITIDGLVCTTKGISQLETVLSLIN